MARNAQASPVVPVRAGLPPAWGPLGGRDGGADRIDDVRRLVPRVLRVGAALGWRLLVVVAALFVIGSALAYLAEVIVPVAITSSPRVIVCAYRIVRREMASMRT